MKKIGAGVGMKKATDHGIGVKIGSAAPVAAKRNAPPSKLGPTQGATSRGTGVGKKGK
jgi:hypothetical protein